MTRQVTDNLYIEIGYLTPEDYYTYEANANIAQASTASMSVSANVITSAVSTMTVTITVTATISHIEGADLFAFSEAAIAVQVDRIRDNNIATSGVFSAVTDVSRVRHFSADDFSSATVLVGDNLRVRYSEAATSAAFSLTADVELVPGGSTVNASGSWTSTATLECQGKAKANIIDCDVTTSFTQSVTGNRIRFGTGLLEVNASVFSNVNEIVQLTASLESTSSISITVNHIKGINLSAFGNAALSVTAHRIKSLESSISSSSSLSAQVGKIIQGASAENALFSPSITVVVTKNSFSVLESVSSLTASIIVVKVANAGLTSIASLSADAARLTQYWYIESQINSKTNNGFTSIKVDSSGNIITAGNADYPSADLIITKRTSLGEILWTRTLGGANNDILADLGIDSSDNIYITGRTTTGIIAKYNSSGALQWQRKLTPSSGSIVSKTIAVTAAGDSYIIGDAYVAKYNTSGALQWQKSVSGASSFQSVQVDSTGAVYILRLGTISSTDINLVKLTSTGSHSWSRQITVGTASNSNPTDLTLDSSNNVYVLSNVVRTGGDRDIVTKYNSSGTLQWKQAYTRSVSQTNYGFSSIICNNDRLYLGSSGPEDYYALVELDKDNASVVWSKKFDPGPGTYFYVPNLITDNTSIYLAGQNFVTISPQLLRASVAKLPLNGSGTPDTGTYTSYSQTQDNSFTITSTTPSTPTVSNTTHTDAAGTLTDASASQTNVVSIAFSNTGQYEQGASTISTTASLTAVGGIFKKTSATLSSQATLTADLSKAQYATADLSSQASQTVNAVKTANAVAGLAAAGFVVTVNGRIRAELADLDTISQLTANVKKYNSGIIDITSNASLSATALRVQTSNVTLTASASLTAELVTIKQFASAVNSQTSQTSQINAEFAAVINAPSLFTPNVTAVISVNPFCEVSVVSNIDVSGRVLRGLTSNTASEFNLISDADVTITTSAEIASAFSQTTSANRLRGTINWLNSEVSQTVLALRLLQLSSNVSSLFTQSAQAQTTTETVVTTSSSFSQETTAQVTRSLTSALTSENNLTANLDGTKEYSADFTAFYSQVTAVAKTGNPLVTIESSASLTAQIGLIKSASSYQYNTGLYVGEGIYGYQDVTLTRTPVVTNYINTGDVISFWFKRESTQQSTYNLIQGSLVVKFVQDKLRIELYTAGSSNFGLFEWTVPTDLDWHHYFIKFNERIGYPLPAGFEQQVIQLWTDGSSQGTQQSTAFGYETAWPTQVTLGYNSSAMSIAQFYAGEGTPTSFAVSDFYSNGWVELTQQEINQAIFYHDFHWNDPHTNTTLTAHDEDSPVALGPTFYSEQGIQQYQSFVAVAQLITNPFAGRIAVSFMESTATLTAQLTVNGYSESNPQATTALTVDGLRLRLAELDFVTTTALTANTTEQTIQGQANLTAESSTSIYETWLLLTRANLTSQAQLTANAIRTVDFSADLAVQGFVLAAGQTIHIDPYLTLTIASETRALTISPESRLQDIETETRNWLIIPESRILTVDSETRVNIIRGL